MTPTLQKTSVDLGGLLQVLAEALYSTPYVAVRELVQNAHDSCERRRLESSATFEPEIVVSVQGTILRITDNGAGLTRDEIDRYLATVGSGYTRNLRARGAGDTLIGYFGLGFLSALVVSERTQVWTCSYQDAGVAHRFVTRSGEAYSVEPAEPRAIGSEVRLELREAFCELADPAVIRACLQRYCSLLTHPVRLEDGEVINALTPPWRLGPEVNPVRRSKLSLEFAQRFEPTFAPIATLPVVHDEPKLGGLLWVQDGASYASSDNRSVAVFVRGMLIGEQERELLPRWAGFIGAVLESPALQPTASRETLKRDGAYDSVAGRVRDALVAGLADLARNDAATWRRILLRHNEAMLGATLCDATLFDLLADQLTLPTSQGELTLPAILERSGGKLLVTQTDRPSVETILSRALRIPIVFGWRFAVLPFCGLYAQRRHGQLVRIGTEAGDRSLFHPALLPDPQVAQLASWFAAPDREVLVRRFEPAYLPFVLMRDREAELKQRIESDDADRRISQAVLSLARKFTRSLADRPSVRMYVNAACPAIQALLGATEVARQRALKLLAPLSALLGDGEINVDTEAALRAHGEALSAILAGDGK